MSATQNSSALYTATSGAVSRMQALDVVSNNLANVNTTGFKRDMVGFEVQLSNAQDSGGPGIIKLNSTTTDQRQGTLRRTDNPLDVAINGRGFFKIDSPQGTAYTRQGNFALDNQGRLITSAGFQVVGDGGPITIPDPDARITFAEDGAISVNGNEVARLSLFDFEDGSSLKKLGKGLFQPPAGLEPQTVAAPHLAQGALEGSNVKLLEEMTRMISYQREYETFQKMIRTYSDLAAKANDIGSF